MARQRAGKTEFWAKVEKMPNGCWLWRGALDKQGYGVVRRTAIMKYMVRAHRYSWLITHGVDAGEYLVCHKCDVPACVNPGHLFLGTNDENMADMAAKMRQAMGVRNSQAKLTDEDVKLIRKLCEDGIPQAVIAKKFRVEQTNISHIKLGKTWKHVP